MPTTCPRGEAVKEVMPGKKFERLNVIGALCAGEYFAVEFYRHTTKAEFFERWFEYDLLPKIPKGHTIIMDNASFHRKKKLRKLARGKVRLLFLPPYSPDFNPIEHSWANMKRYLRSYLKTFPSLDSALYTYFRLPDI
jgi:transposase